MLIPIRISKAVHLPAKCLCSAAETGEAPGCQEMSPVPTEMLPAAPTIRLDDHPCGWLAPEGIWDATKCSVLSCFLKRAQCQVPEGSLAVVCVISLNFGMPWCNTSLGDSTFHPRGVNAGAVSFQPGAGAAALKHVQQSGGVRVELG